MKKWFLPLLAALMLLAGAALAAEAPRVYLSVTECDGGEMPAASVEWVEKKHKFYFFLPGGADEHALRIWLPEGTEASLDGVPLRSGGSFPFAEGSGVLTVSGIKYPVVVMQGSAIPALFISTESGSMDWIDRDKANKEPGALLFLNPDGTADYDGALKHVKLRGNTSAVLNKKNYALKLENGADLAGMGKAKRWCLLGSYRDHAMIRNQIVYDMARFAGLPWTPDCVQTDVYLNHRYHGLYLLTEKIEINDHRVEVADLEEANEAANPLPPEEYPSIGTLKVARGKYKAFELEHDPDDITGGYIIEYENWQKRYATEACAYTTQRGKVLLIKDPEIVSRAEMEYISSFMQGYENAIFAKDGIDPVSGKHYSQFVDFDSLVRKYMLEEVSLNCDGNASSQYYVKPPDRESRVAYAGPAWDYDITFGSYATSSKKKLLDPEALFHTRVNGSMYWWPQLYRRKEFFSAVQDVWAESYAPAMRVLLGLEKDPSGALRSVEDYAAAIEKSAAMNFIRWPYGAPGKESSNIARTGVNFRENLDYLTNFITRRYVFLDSVWGDGTAKAELAARKKQAAEEKAAENAAPEPEETPPPSAGLPEKNPEKLTPNVAGEEEKAR